MVDCYPSFAASGSTECVTQKTPSTSACRIGLALGGGFARGIAHAGVLNSRCIASKA
jgi:hypothetical protein